MTDQDHAHNLLTKVNQLRARVGERFRDDIVTSLYADADRIAEQVVSRTGAKGLSLGERVDRILTHPVWAVPTMLALLALVFWITVVGANVPSAFLAGVLIDEGGLTGWLQHYFGVQAPVFLTHSLYDLLNSFFSTIGLPVWLHGFLLDGVYLCLAWVISVMLPPMAIFFPLFTLLEDVGYLPRIAFNLDWLFSRAGAHGKQALTMSMGFGCNAAGVISCRIIDSPREKLIAILTNNFMICNGRFPTVIAISMVLAAATVPAGLLSAFTAMMVVGVVMLGVLFTFLTSLLLSRTVLKGRPSAFTLELPPYRRPAVLSIIYRSIIERTLFVLARACVVSLPAGAAIWIVSNVTVSGLPLSHYIIEFLQPLGWLMGLDGAILLAYIIAIPANEIVLPTVLMLYMQSSRMMEAQGDVLSGILTSHGWTPLTAVCLLLFCLLHNPCGTTIWTIWRETRSIRWTLLATFMPVVMGIVFCSLVAGVWRIVT
ncbi:MAG TPA: ferrous iron transporter B [Phycisphaeraceae bacterium]|nr:ferrous iron transporter B [Phycisphaeraceae bacterium]